MRTTHIWATAVAGALLTGVLPATADAAGAPVARDETPAPPPVAAVEPGDPTLAPTRTPRSTLRTDRIGDRPSAAAAKRYLGERRGTYAIEPGDLRSEGEDRVAGSPVVAQRFQQTVNGVPVHGAQYIVRMTGSGDATTVVGTSGTYYSDLAVSTTPRLGKDRVQELVGRHLRESGVRDARVSVGGLEIQPVGKGRLAYQVRVTGTNPRTRQKETWSGLADASLGRVLAAWPALKSAGEGSVTTTGTTVDGRTVPLHLTRDAASGRYLFRDTTRPMYTGTSGEILTYDLKGGDRWQQDPQLASTATIPAKGEVTTGGAVDAHHNVGEVYEYYRSRFGRSSVDGKGMTIKAFTNFTEDGEPVANAYWDDYNGAMYFSGPAAGLKPFAESLDVAAHELTHGVISHTAGLEYHAQSGAMSEAYADYFGNAVQVDVEKIPMTDPRAALVGETLCTDKGPKECAIRDMLDGRTTKDYQGVLGDMAGVHLNATIYGGALWRIRRALGAELGDRLVYAALTQYLTPKASFTDGLNAHLAAARDLGLGARGQWVVHAAFGASGIHDGWEKTLPNDAKVLHRGLTTMVSGMLAMMPWPSLAGTTWAADDPTTEASDGIRVGDVRTGRSRVVSPNDGWLHSFPKTDGRTVVWRAEDAAAEEVHRRVWAYDVASGKSRVVYDGDAMVIDVKVSGPRIVWAATTTDGASEVFTRVGNGAVTQVPIPSGHFVYATSVRGDDLALDLQGADATGTSMRTKVLRNLVTGRTLTVEPPAVDKVGYGRDDMVLTAHHLVYKVQRGTSGKATFMARDKGGWGEAVTVVDETQADAPTSPFFDASDEALTFTSSDGLGSYDPATSSKAMQVSLDGGRPWSRVSCNAGAQGDLAMDERRGVAFIDATLGGVNLLYRATPAGSCRTR